MQQKSNFFINIILLGPVGGDGGSFKNSIASLPPVNHCFNTFLDGIKV